MNNKNNKVEKYVKLCEDLVTQTQGIAFKRVNTTALCKSNKVSSCFITACERLGLVEAKGAGRGRLYRAKITPDQIQPIMARRVLELTTEITSKSKKTAGKSIDYTDFWSAMAVLRKHGCKGFAIKTINGASFKIQIDE